MEAPLTEKPMPTFEAAGKDLKAEASQTLAGQDFATKLTEAWRTQNDELNKPQPQKERKPDTRFDRDHDPANDPVDDPKGVLEQLKTEIAKSEKSKGKQPAAEKPAEAKADKPAEQPEADYPDNAKSPEAKSSWDKLKADRAEKEKLLREREAELLELKKQFDPEAYKKFKEENEKLSQELRRLNVERHPKFKEAFEKPLAEAIDRAKRAIPANYHADADKWLKAPDSPEKDAAIQEITNSLPPHKAGAFIRYVEDAQIALDKRSEALKNEQEYISRFEAEQKSAQEKARMQAEASAKAVFQSVLQEKFADNPLFTGEEAKPRIQYAESILFGENKPEQLAEAAFWASYGREVAPLLQKAHDELTAAYAQIDKLSGKSMGKEAGAATSQAASSESPNDIWSAINAEFRRLNQR